MSQRNLRIRLSSIFILLIPCGVGFLWLSDYFNDRPIEWVNYSHSSFDKLMDDGQPVLLFFDADWDLTGEVVERAGIDVPRVKKFIRKHGVTAMRADCTDQSADNEASAKLESVNQGRVPIVVIYHPGSKVDQIKLPDLVQESELMEALQTSLDVEPEFPLAYWFAIALLVSAVLWVVNGRREIDSAK